MGPIISVEKTDGTTITPCIEPLKCNITRSDLYSDSTGRSAETGKLLQYPIRRGLYSIELEYLGNDANISQIEDMIDDVKLIVTFLHNGSEVEAEMYPSDRINETEIILNGIGRHRLSFSLIEV